MVVIVLAIAAGVIPVLVVVVVGRRLRSVQVGRPVASELIIERVVVAAGTVRQLPQLRPPAGLPHSLEDLLLVGPSGDGDLLEAQVYLDRVHA